MSYQELERAEKRLDRNLNNSFWSFATYSSFQIGFIYVVVEKLPEIVSSSILTGIISIIGGTFLHIVALMSSNTYRSNIKANENCIGKLEAIQNDFQQKEESEWPKPYLSGAGKARHLMFWFLWITEIATGIFFIFK